MKNIIGIRLKTESETKFAFASNAKPKEKYMAKKNFANIYSQDGKHISSARSPWTVNIITTDNEDSFYSLIEKYGMAVDSDYNEIILKANSAIDAGNQERTNDFVKNVSKNTDTSNGVHEDIISISQSINLSLAKKVLQFKMIEYFNNIDVNDLDIAIHPVSISSIVEKIPQLEGKIEIIPTAVDLDPRNGHSRIEWNLYVLGIFRLYLGETMHKTSQDIRDISSGNYYVDPLEVNNVINPSTPKKIIKFISEILFKDKSGIIDFSDEVETATSYPGRIPATLNSTMAGSIQGHGFAKHSPVSTSYPTTP